MNSNNQQAGFKFNAVEQTTTASAEQVQQQESQQHYSNKIYIPEPQKNRQIIQNINNVEKQCNIYQIISPNMQGQSQTQTKSSFDFLQTLLFLSKSVSMDQSCSSTQLDSQSLIKTKKHHCNCKKTKCLKLYCECFVNNEECDASCNCIDCSNNQACSVQRNHVIESILERKTHQEHSKFKIIEHSQSINYHRGCNCKKSGCQKKYCECYHQGVPCSEYCKCDGCQNTLSCKKVKFDFESSSNQPFNEEIQSQQSQQSRNISSDLHEKLLQFLQYADQQEEINQQS